jgi:hypothetical protein
MAWHGGVFVQGLLVLVGGWLEVEHDLLHCPGEVAMGWRWDGEVVLRQGISCS